MLTPKQIIEWLKLQPNRVEGGYFAGTYESTSRVPGPCAGSATEDRPLCSAIYYLLDHDTRSVIHRVTGDMIYHFYGGDPVEMLLLYPEGFASRSEVCMFSSDIAAGGRPMKVIPGGTWLGSRLTPGGVYSLMGVTMAPGFDPKDYAIGKRDDLVKVIELTRD